MASWIMLCLELIIDCIILVFSPHSFACSLYLYSFFASEKKKEIPRLYNGCFIFHIKIEPSFFLLFFFYMPTLVSHKKKKIEESFTSFIAMSSQDSFSSAHYFHRSRVSTMCKCCRSVCLAEEQKDLAER